MAVGSAFWPTIVTVIPVIALALGAEYRRVDWARKSPGSRVWHGGRSVILVIGLSWAEVTALGELGSTVSSEKLKDAIALVVIAGVLEILIVPLGPLMYIATHDFEKPFRTVSRQLTRAERDLGDLWRSYEEGLADRGHMYHELTLLASEEILRFPNSVYSDDGKVRSNYKENVRALATRSDFDRVRMEASQKLKTDIWKAERHQKRIRKQFERLRRNRTKRIMKQLDFKR